MDSKEKKIPKFILNSTKECKHAFFEGYYDADGRKKGHEKYEYKGFTTKSATLCLGLICLVRELSDQKAKCKCEYKDGKRYYRVQLSCGYETNRGMHRRKNLQEVINIEDTVSSDGWFYDIQTESETFATGANLVKIHNSPKRGAEFVTKKIIRSAVRIKLGLEKELRLGNLDAKRDWGYAKEYVEAMWLMLQQDEPDDFVIATGETHTVREFCDLTFKRLYLDYNDYVVVDPKFYRPAEVFELCGDYTKAKEKLGWEPKVKFSELVELMVDAEMESYVS